MASPRSLRFFFRFLISKTIYETFKKSMKKENTALSGIDLETPQGKTVKEHLEPIIANILQSIELHAEGMKHMTNALIAFDSRVKELEKALKTRKIIRLNSPII